MSKTLTSILNKLLTVLVYASFVSLVVGPVGRLPLGSPLVNIYLSDLIVACMFVIWMVKIKTAVRLIKNDRVSRYFLFFIGVGFTSLIFSPLVLSWQERGIAFLYLLRVFAYFSMYLTICVTPVSVRHLAVVGVSLSILGWVQYFFYPSLRNLSYLGWDPHDMRIFATYFDPNYLGLIFVLALVVLFTLPSTVFVWIGRITIYVTLAFTYSRSSFLALLSVSFLYSFVKKRYAVFAFTVLLLVLTVFFLPRRAQGGAGVKLERTFSITERLATWKQGFTIFFKHPILGMGFNAVRYAKRAYGFLPENRGGTHADAGFDNSFIVVAATTGMVGLVAFIAFLKALFKGSTLFARLSLSAIIVHSLFLNSFFFPWVMLWMWSATAIGKVRYDDQRLLMRQKIQA